jgi:hypothetical protein
VADGRGISVKCGTTISEWGILRNDPGFMRPFTNIEDMLHKTELVMKEYPNAMVEKAYKWAKEEMSWEKAIVKFREAMLGKSHIQTAIEGKTIL